jgi:soluble lytic murein transglycosylase
VRRRLALVILLFLLVLNYDTIGRFLYPFPYRETTFYYARAYGVDPFLLAAVMKTESNFNSRAVSERGARGLMQIMPDTGRWVARQLGESSFQPDRLFEPETSIKYGAWYLADLEKEFQGDTILILAAYNGGRGNVKDWLTSKNLTVGKSSIDQIPFPETRHYVKKVLIFHRIYNFLYR